MINTVEYWRDADGIAQFSIEQVVGLTKSRGMEYGYVGSGPAAFAMNLIYVAIGDEDLACVPILYQRVKDRLVASISRDASGKITVTEIRSVIELILLEHGDAVERQLKRKMVYEGKLCDACMERPPILDMKYEGWCEECFEAVHRGEDPYA